MRYRYNAVNEAGKKIEGQASGSESEVLKSLRARGWTLVSLREEDRKDTVAGIRLGEAELEVVFSRLAYLVSNGVKVDKAMTLLARGALPESIQAFVEDISIRLNEGSTLHDALQDYKGQIDQIYLASIRLGEEIGNLGSTFSFISSSLQGRIRLRKEIQKATIYPASVLVFSILALFFIFNFIVPRITGIFKGVEDLPWYTQALIASSNFTTSYQLQILFIFLGVAGFGVWIVRNPANRTEFYPYLLRIPVIRTFLTQAEQIRFSGAMSLALGSGLLVYNAIQIAAYTVRNPVSQRSLLTAAREISEGKSAAAALADAHFLPEFHASLLEVSQDREALGTAFADIAGRLEAELNDSISRVLVLIEPLLIGVMGIIIGGIVLVMMLSILSIQNIGL